MLDARNANPFRQSFLARVIQQLEAADRGTVQLIGRGLALLRGFIEACTAYNPEQPAQEMKEMVPAVQLGRQRVAATNNGASNGAPSAHQLSLAQQLAGIIGISEGQALKLLKKANNSLGTVPNNLRPCG